MDSASIVDTPAANTAAPAQIVHFESLICRTPSSVLAKVVCTLTLVYYMRSPVATIGLPVKDPLVGPLAAIASGILVSRYIPFQPSELVLVIAGLMLLGIVALWRNSRALAGVCACLGFFFAGILTNVA